MSAMRHTSLKLHLRMLERRVDIFDREHEVSLLIEGRSSRACSPAKECIAKQSTTF
jgi:hypothetical protein